MTMSVQVVQPGAVEPVSLATLKSWLRVDQDWTGDDALITMLGKAARRMIERGFDSALITQTIQLTLDRFPVPGNPFLWQQYSFGYWYDRIPMMSLAGSWWPDRAAIFVPYPPLQSVLSIQYVDMTGTLQTLDPSSYLVDTQRTPGRITPVPGGYWPYTQTQTDAVQIQYQAGYGLTPESVPETIQTAICIAVYQWYEDRKEPDALPAGAMNLLRNEWGGEYY